MLKEIKFSDHARIKLDLLNERGVAISQEQVIDTIRFPQSQEITEEDKLIAQKPLDEALVLRVVYREYTAFILIITLYPGRRSRYEKTEI